VQDRVEEVEGQREVWRCRNWRVLVYWIHQFLLQEESLRIYLLVLIINVQSFDSPIHDFCGCYRLIWNLYIRGVVV